MFFSIQRVCRTQSSGKWMALIAGGTESRLTCSFLCNFARAVGTAAIAHLGATCLAHAQSNGAPGVNPKDNITKGEFFLKSDRLSGGNSLQAMAVKYDRAFNTSSGANVEIPWLRMSTSTGVYDGLGDIAMRLRYVTSSGPWSVISAVEVVAPTAGRDDLGSGKWQINPAIGAVYALTQTSFVYAGYRHVLSVAGDDHRAAISDMQPRVLLVRVWPKGHWAMADVKYTRSLKGNKSEVLDMEAEAGTMLSRDVGAWIRLGTSRYDSPRQTGLLVGLRKIW